MITADGESKQMVSDKAHETDPPARITALAVNMEARKYFTTRRASPIRRERRRSDYYG